MSIELKDGKLLVSELEFEDPDVLECFKDIKPKDLENRFRLAVKVGIMALKTIGTTEKVDYIEKEFNKLDTKFNKILEVTSDQLSESIGNIFGEEGTLPSIMEANFGEDGKINRLMEDHLGDKGTFSQQLEAHFGKDGKIIKEIFDPYKEGTPLNQLKTEIATELRAIKEALAIDEVRKEDREKMTLKGKDFEDQCEDLLDVIVRNHRGDVLQRTGTAKGETIHANKGDFVVDVSGKTEYRIAIEAKNWDKISMSEINKEIDGALKNRGAKYGILVAKYHESLPKGVGCFNYYNDDRIICSLGSKEDEVFHEEILHVAYCWARANILRKSANCVKVDFESIDNNLTEIKSQLDLLNKIRSHCSNINGESKKIVAVADDIEANIERCLANVKKEMLKGEKGMEIEVE